MTRFQEELRETTRYIENGEFRSSDVKSLLVDLRFKGSPIIDDLANFCTHRGIRNQGIVFETIRNYSNKILTEMQNGVLASQTPPPVYTSEEIMNELERLLRRNGVYVNSSRLRSQNVVLMNSIFSLMQDEVVMDVNDKRAKSISVKREKDGNVWLYIKISNEFDNKIIKISSPAAEVTIRTPLINV